VFVCLKSNFTISDKKGEIEKIFDRLREVMRVDNKLEEIDYTDVGEQFLELLFRCIKTNEREKSWALTMATFLVVSFCERAISASFNSCGLVSSALFFSSFERFAPVARSFRSIARGPNLNSHS